MARSALRRAESLSAGEPSSTFAAASIELYSRLWLELERLIESLETDQADRRVVLVRLELLVLLDACESPRWQGMLSAEQNAELRSTLLSVLHALAELSSLPVDDVIAEAQNCLLDAVLNQLDVAARQSGRCDMPATVSLVAGATTVPTASPL
jgi:hypothetical protein